MSTTDTTLPMTGKAGRIASLDAFRVVAILGVICIHTSPFLPARGFRGPVFEGLWIAIQELSRGAVPFFFITCGYFLGAKLRQGAPPWPTCLRYCARLAGIVAFWSLIFCLLPMASDEPAGGGYAQFVYSRISLIWRHPIATLSTGTMYHLWFLPALCCAVVILAPLVAAGRTTTLMLLGAGIYIAGLLLGPYAVLLGHPPRAWVRDGPIFSLLLVSIGYCLSSGRFRLDPFQAMVMALAGLALQAAETLLLWRCFGQSPIGHDYLVGTVPFAVGEVMLLLALPDLARGSALPRMGKYALGAYAGHVIFIDAFNRWPWLTAWPGSWFRELQRPLLVLVLAFGLAWAISKLPPLKRFVT